MSELIDLDALERLAGEATPGPWEYERQSVMAGDEFVVEVVQDVITERRWPSEADARFISECDPETVAALVRAVRAAMDLVAESRYHAGEPLVAALAQFRATG